MIQLAEKRRRLVHQAEKRRRLVQQTEKRHCVFAWSLVHQAEKRRCCFLPRPSASSLTAWNLEQQAGKRRCCPPPTGFHLVIAPPTVPADARARGGSRRHREEEDDDEIDVPMMLRYAVFPLGSPSVSFKATRLYPPATCPLPSQSHSDSLTVPGSSAARLPQDMPNGLKVRDHDWRSASSRDSAGPWNPRGKNACRESSRLKSARVQLSRARKSSKAVTYPQSKAMLSHDRKACPIHTYLHADRINGESSECGSRWR